MLVEGFAWCCGSNSFTAAPSIDQQYDDIAAPINKNPDVYVCDPTSSEVQRDGGYWWVSMALDGAASKSVQASKRPKVTFDSRL